MKFKTLLFWLLFVLISPYLHSQISNEEMCILYSFAYKEFRNYDIYINKKIQVVDILPGSAFDNNLYNKMAEKNIKDNFNNFTTDSIFKCCFIKKCKIISYRNFLKKQNRLNFFKLFKKKPSEEEYMNSHQKNKITAFCTFSNIGFYSNYATYSVTIKENGKIIWHFYFFKKEKNIWSLILHHIRTD